MQYRTTSFQIDYPDSFSAQEQPIDEATINQLGLRVTFTSQDGKAQVKISTQHFEMMQALDLPQGWSAESFAGRAKMQYESQGQDGLKDFHYISSGNISITGVSDIVSPPEAYKLEYTFTDPKLGNIQELEVFVASNAPYYFYDLEFESSPGNFSVFHNTFYGMINSFRALPYE
jgi:hypothetical protein